MIGGLHTPIGARGRCRRLPPTCGFCHEVHRCPVLPILQPRTVRLSFSSPHHGGSAPHYSKVCSPCQPCLLRTMLAFPCPSALCTASFAAQSSCRLAWRTLTCIPVRQADRQAAPTASQPWLPTGATSFQWQPQQPQPLGGCQAPASGLHPPAEQQTRTASGSGWPAMRQQGPVAAAATLWMLSQTRPCT